MTYSDWSEQHAKEKAVILNKLINKGMTVKEITTYFQYDNMKEAEPSFCPLYETNTKCHNVNNLNCYLCGCPYFEHSDVPITHTPDKTPVFSICTVGSRYAKTFINDNKAHCDCSDCIVPHSNHVVEKFIEKAINEND